MDREHQRILVVEDDTAVADLLRILLESERYHVSVADTAARALELLRKQAFDLVVLDYALPDLEGPRLVEALRSVPRAARLPVVVVTGYPVSLADLPVDAVLSKPPDATQLLQLVRQKLEKTRTADRGP